ncbi:hypothetical protein FHX82_000360 [Amycolatopsis bartoniae]|uniref:DUF5926 domain-containing protein n=1 Tax=Amycolatopsis bartoniae TaxID=941986 RepID=A0A8H9IST0_9PSEU|nr:DUF5926 family protein [Amycolatopsis bartoniae]MBB2933340.1 hypothetical protein [Amycolatopsis bartoniae]TVT08056.1 hypothetical protein FNH07_13835 [Amycolatopsis bartoniae]GHF58825.1 hypothetical protein GCM10017566_35240 [Amycolatopsis bartoniae]
MGKASRKKNKAPKVRDVFVAQPFEGLAAEPELIALREFVPSATAKLTLRDSDREITLATVLPGAAAAFVRTDERVFVGLQVQTRSSDLSRDLGRSVKWALEAKPGDVLNVPDTTSAPADGERLQDLLVADAELDVTLHENFDWWLPEDAAAEGEVKLSLDRANEAIMPTERLGKGSYWVLAGEKAHLRWVRPEPENKLLQALARLSAAGELNLGEGSRYAGSFRAHGLLVPVWDLDPEAHAREWAEPAEQLGARLEKALASLDSEPLDATERRARDGLIGRQLTLR